MSPRPRLLLKEAVPSTLIYQAVNHRTESSLYILDIRIHEFSILHFAGGLHPLSIVLVIAHSLFLSFLYGKNGASWRVEEERFVLFGAEFACPCRL